MSFPVNINGLLRLGVCPQEVFFTYTDGNEQPPFYWTPVTYVDNDINTSVSGNDDYNTEIVMNNNSKFIGAMGFDILSGYIWGLANENPTGLDNWRLFAMGFDDDDV